MRRRLALLPATAEDGSGGRLIGIHFERHWSVLPHAELSAAVPLRRAGIPCVAETLDAAGRFLPALARAGLSDVSAVLATPAANLTGDAPLLAVALGLVAAAVDDRGAEVFVAVGAVEPPARPDAGALAARLAVVCRWLEDRPADAPPVPVFLSVRHGSAPAVAEADAARMRRAGGRLMAVASLADAVQRLRAWPGDPSRHALAIPPSPPSAGA